MTIDEIVGRLREMSDESIYDEPGRLAHPDEVWNYRRGDGVEKALLLANVLRARSPEAGITIEVSDTTAACRTNDCSYDFPTHKQLEPTTWDTSAIARV